LQRRSNSSDPRFSPNILRRSCCTVEVEARFASWSFLTINSEKKIYQSHITFYSFFSQKIDGKWYRIQEKKIFNKNNLLLYTTDWRGKRNKKFVQKRSLLVNVYYVHNIYYVLCLLCTFIIILNDTNKIHNVVVNI